LEEDQLHYAEAAMKKRDITRFVLVLVFVLQTVLAYGEESMNPFAGESLPGGWTWKRENPDAWRLRGGGLEIKIEPGNMWGGKNDAKNVLLIPTAKEMQESGTDVQVTLANSPTRRWEQVDLVWYFRDSHMVKIGLELEHGKNSVVMGREESDRTRTIKIVPIEKDQVTVRLKVAEGQVQGYYRLAPSDEWTDVGTCTEPRPAEGHDKPQVSIQCYQGDPKNPHWARITDLKIDAIEETKAQRNARMQWWRDAKFGMFIHWGIYAVPAGIWDGEIVDAKHGSEWIQCDALLTRAQYEPYAKQFNPLQFNAIEWVNIARNAGMKYLVITSKHHDGFSIYDTQASDYDIVDATPFTRDPLKELSVACKKAGVRFGAYYSQLDWHHPAQENNPERNGRHAYRFNRIRPGLKDQYIADMKVQLRELIVDYGVEVLFFDGEWVSWWTREDGRDLMRYVRSLNPNIIVNNRVGKRKREDGDYGTPEQRIPQAGLDYDWETCMTMNGTWGYKNYDHSWKTTTDLVQKLVDIASKGGNFLLNVGPTAEGIIPEPSVERLREMGQWMQINGEAVYGTRLWNPNAQYDPAAEAVAFGPGPEERSTEAADSQTITKKDGIRYTLKDDTLYAIFFTWPGNGKVTFTELASGRISNEIGRIELLGSTKEIKWSRNNAGLTVHLPATQPCQHAFALKISVAK
jgi:alpha-L-fucosidase